MSRTTYPITSLYCLVSFSILLQQSVIKAEPSDYLSPVDLKPSADGKTIFVAEQTSRQIDIFDVAQSKVVKSIKLEDRPSNMALSRDGNTLYVAGAEAAGHIFVIQMPQGQIIKKFNVGHTPMAPVLSLDNKTLFVCNRFNSNVSVIDLDTGNEKTRIPVTREPIAAVLSADGNFLFVANHLPKGRANVDFMTSVIDIIDTTTLKVAKSLSLPNGAIDLRGMCLSHDGKYVYVPSIFARFLVPTTQIERGWINTHAVNLIDTTKQELWHTVLLDDVDMGAANPWGIVCSTDGKYICVAHSATHEISLIDQAALIAKLAKVPLRDPNQKREEYEASSKNPANDLSFLTGIRRRIKLKGIGPREITVINNTVYATEYFSDSIATLNLASDTHDVTSIPIGPQKPMNNVRKGEMYFNDAALCFQQWQSCSTCHPDASMDAVNWDLLNDGIGNPKSTKSLLYSTKTPPVMATGVRDKAETAVRTGIRFIQFAVPEEEKALTIDEYIRALRPVTSPFLINGKLSEAAERGKKIFDSAGCSSCHSGEYFTDMQPYDVGTGDGREKDMAFDTPTLIEVWRSAPYLYDGRAANMEEVFTKYNPKDQHGATSKLTPEQLEDLIEYVMSL